MGSGPRDDQSTLLRNALRKIKQLVAQVEALERARSEPIAIIGLGCRFSGAVTEPEGLWRRLLDGTGAVGEVPPERWDLGTLFDRDPDAPGRLSTRWAGLLDDHDCFDAELFGITPREAQRMDPHQRVLLEVAWEALDNAGQRAPELRGSRTGVFIGLSPFDYPALEISRVLEIDSYSASGACGSVVAGRLSYLLDLRGPSMVVDTACSSSLVAVHQACRSLRNGECDLAIAGGINLLLAPWSSMAACKMRTMASDGRCKTFDARADGYVRGEGCGVVVLKRLSSARAASDSVWAVIRGSAVNQDGRSTSLTAPSLTSQREVIRAALDDAHVGADEVGYVETHGTGTALGDSIEVEALRQVYGGRDPGASPCYLGAAKTVFGHLEAAAGMVGLSAAIMSLHHGRITPVHHFERLNPNITLEGTRFVIPTEQVPWPRGERPRVAGVSSFGFCGTNAHMILEEAVESEDTEAARLQGAPTSALGPYVLPISAHGTVPLRTLAARHRDLLAAEAPALEDVCHTAALRRTERSHRLALVGGSAHELIGALERFVRDGALPASSVQGVAEQGRPPVFVFSGQGGQWPAMGKALSARFEVFRDALARCDEALRPHADRSVRDLVMSEHELGAIEACQPAIFAIQVALAELWGALGVRAAAVVGHSLGEVAAAHVAGVLSLEDAARVVHHRSRLLQRLSGRGGMAVVGLSIDEARERLGEGGLGLEVAVSLGPRQVVLSGEVAELDALLARLGECNVFGRRVRVDVASHHSGVDALSDELHAALASITPRRAVLPLYSTVMAAPLDGEQCTASYWFQNMRRPVRFHETIGALLDQGHERFIEIGPHPVLQIAIEQTAASREREVVAVPSMTREQPLESFAASAASLWTRGQSLDWRKLLPAGRPTVRMPVHPWQRKRYPVRDWRTHGEVHVEPTPASTAATELHGLAWRPAPHPGTAATRPLRVLVLADASGLAERLCARIERAGGHCVRVHRATHGSTAEGPALVVDPAAPRAFEPVLGVLTAGDGRAFDHVIDLWGIDAAADPPAGLLEPLLRACCGDLLQFLQAAAGARSLTGSRLWIATRGAQRLEPDRGSVAVSQATLWGLGRVLAQEHPELWGGLVDLDPDAADDDAVADLLDEISQGTRGEQVAYRRGQRRVLRLSPLERASAPPRPVAIRPEATYLITGGLGGLGLESARWLVRSGARHIICLGRSGEGEGAAAILGELRQAGARVLVVKVDVSNGPALERALAEALATAPPLRGVIHTAAVVNDGVLLKLDWSQFREVFAAKAQGSWNLHELTRRHALDFFIMYSSAAALIGLLGHATYAASNAFLDALAQHRRALGLPALSIDWPVWKQVGLGKRVEGKNPIPGLRPIDVARGFELLEQMIPRSDAQIAVLPIDWELHFSTAAHERVPFFAEMRSRHRARASSPASDAGPPVPSVEEAPPALLLQLRRALPVERRHLLTSYVREQVARVLGFEVTAVEEAGFFQLGMDSIRALELKNRLQNAFGCFLPATTVFDHPTVASLTELLLQQVASDERTGSDEEQHAPPSAATTLDDDAERGKVLEVLERLARFSEGELEALKNRDLEP